MIPKDRTDEAVEAMGVFLLAAMLRSTNSLILKPDEIAKAKAIIKQRGIPVTISKLGRDAILLIDPAAQKKRGKHAATKV